MSIKIPPHNKACDDWLSSFIEYHKGMAVHENAITWAGLVSLGAALGRKVWVRTDLRLPPCSANQYVILVGKAGNGKGLSMGTAESLMKQVGVNLLAEHSTLRGILMQMEENCREVANVQNPFAESSEVGTFTHETAVVWASELKNFVQNSEDFNTTLNKFWDGHGGHSHVTAHHGENTLLAPCLSIMAGITPDSLQDVFPLEALRTGFGSRILFIDVPRVPQNPRPDKISPPDNQRRFQLRVDLDWVHRWEGEMKLSESWWDAQESWFIEHEEKLATKSGGLTYCSPTFEGFQERKRHHLIKLSMICAASRGSGVIEDVDFYRALGFLSDVEDKLPSLLISREQSNEGYALNIVSSMMRARPGTTFTLADLLVYVSDFVDEKILNRLLLRLVSEKNGFEFTVNATSGDMKFSFNPGVMK